MGQVPRAFDGAWKPALVHRASAAAFGRTQTLPPPSPQRAGRARSSRIDCERGGMTRLACGPNRFTRLPSSLPTFFDIWRFAIFCEVIPMSLRSIRS